MKIIIVAPKSTSKGSPFRYDYAVWNFYLPLMSLGHQVVFFDSSKYGDKELQFMISKEKPDLLFCIMTGDINYCPKEPWDTIKSETIKGNIKTFNWFCDDSWRFENFSKHVCGFFHCASTPEIYGPELYKKNGYNNIIQATWHANSELYSGLNITKKQQVAFVGAEHGERSIFLNLLRSSHIKVNKPNFAGFEDLIEAYSNSLIGINFSKNSVNQGTQMKARPFEITACGSMLITEYTEGIEEFFKIDKEIICFKTSSEMLEKVKYLINKPSLAANIAKSGHNRFLKDHQSKIRLQKLIQEIKKI